VPLNLLKEREANSIAPVYGEGRMEVTGTKFLNVLPDSE